MTSHRFRWVFCQLEILSQSFPSSVRHILKELPESLDQTYEWVLREIRKANQGHAYRLLQCLVAAVRPLRVEDLAEVLAVDFEAEGSFNFPTSQKDVKTPFEVLSQTLPIPPDTRARRPEAKPRRRRANPSNRRAGRVSSPP